MRKAPHIEEWVEVSRKGRQILDVVEEAIKELLVNDIIEFAEKINVPYHILRKLIVGALPISISTARHIHQIFALPSSKRLVDGLDCFTTSSSTGKTHGNRIIKKLDLSFVEHRLYQVYLNHYKVDTYKHRRLFADTLHITTIELSLLFNGYKKLKVDTAQQIEKVFNVSRDWLLTGIWPAVICTGQFY